MKNFITSFFKTEKVLVKLKVIQKIDKTYKNFLTINKLTDIISVGKEDGYRVFLLIEGEK
jgi:hypothetical protein